MKMKLRLMTLVVALVLVLSLMPGSGVAAQKWPAPDNVVVSPTALIMHGLFGRATVSVVVKRVSNFYAADFRLEFDPSLVRVVEVKSGNAFDHPDQTGLPIVQVFDGYMTFANTRFGDPIHYADSLTLARVTFESVVPGPTGPIPWGGGSVANIADKQANVYPFSLTGTYQVNTGGGIVGQTSAIAGIPVQMTTSAGFVLDYDWTDAAGFYPSVGAFGNMPASGQIRINPIAGAGSLGRLPALEARLTDCPAAINMAVHRVGLVFGDVAPIHPGITGDNNIDILDLVMTAHRMYEPALDINVDGWTDGDVNRDNIVDIKDLVIIANNFGRQGPRCYSCP
jgi:hypothetical protein